MLCELSYLEYFAIFLIKMYFGENVKLCFFVKQNVTESLFDKI